MNILITIGAILFGTGIWLYILRRYDRVEPESLRYLVQVAIVGGLASVIVAALLNELISSFLGIRGLLFAETRVASIGGLLAFCLFVGFNEEIWKATATVFTTRKLGDLNEPVDAMIYAMTVGLGFASIENLIYATRFGNDVLLVRFDEKVYAYRNACAHMNMPLDGGMMDEHVLACPWHGFKYDLTSGECITVPQAQLEPFPLRVDEGIIYVRPD